VEVNHTKGLNIGQMTYNALGASEYNYVNTYLQLRYATDAFDHEYLKTGTGIGEPDFRVAED
jgi:hypothetical protein